jgi:hypothetical protein
VQSFPLVQRMTDLKLQLKRAKIWFAVPKTKEVYFTQLYKIMKA